MMVILQATRLPLLFGALVSVPDTLSRSASAEYFSGETGWLLMQRPKVDDHLILLADFGKAEAIVVEVLNNPATEEGTLLKVMKIGRAHV